jgi:hypothetical protein
MALVVIAASLVAGCGRIDGYSSLPEAIRYPKPEPRQPDPEPQVAALLQGTQYSVFAESAHPTNVMIAMPRRDPGSLGWIFCIKADVVAVDGSAMGTQTFLVHVEQGNIGRRRPAEPGDGCESDTYHRFTSRAAVTRPERRSK